MGRTLSLIACLCLLWGCARLSITVDIYEPGPEGLAETAIARNFRTFAQFFTTEEARIQQLFDVEVKGAILEAVETCFEGGDIDIVKESYEKHFDKYSTQRSQVTDQIAAIIRYVLGRYDLSSEGRLPASLGEGMKPPTDTEIRAARMQIVPLLHAREDALSSFIKVIRKDLEELQQSCEKLAKKREDVGKSHESKDLQKLAEELKEKSQDVESIPQIREVRGIEQQLRNVAETTVVEGGDPNAPLLVRSTARWRTAFNRARSFSGLSKSQFIVVQESLTDYRVKTVTSDPRQVFNTAVEIGKQTARTVSMIYGFPIPTAPATGTSGAAPENFVDTLPLLEEETEALRVHEGRLIRVQRDLRRDLQSSLDTLRASTLTGRAFDEEKAKILGAIDRAVIKLEGELAVIPVLERESFLP